MKTLVIQNPYSSRWTSKKRTDELLAALTDAGLEYDHVQTDSPDQAVEIAAKACKDGYEAIIAAGGDGTIGEKFLGLLIGTKDARESGKRMRQSKAYSFTRKCDFITL